VATAISIVCFVVAALGFGWGFVTEYRQSRAAGPVAIVPTLPFAVAAGLFVEFGVLWLRLGIPFWVHVIVLLGSTGLFVFAILKVSAGRYSH
jgi:hypothetical protein